MIQRQMEAIVVWSFGPVENMAMHSIPVPEPGPDEVLIQVMAVSANFVDTLVVTGAYQFLPPFPFSPGKLPTGIVRKVGSEVTSIAVGDRVQTMAESGGYAQFAVAKADSCYALPVSMSFAEAASIALCFDTAWFALKDRGRIAAGETVLVLGASGAVGVAAIQLAKAFGATVLAGVSSPRRAPVVEKAGADHVIDLGCTDIREALRDQVRATTDDRGADIVIDTLGDSFTEAALRSLAWRGRLVVIGFAAGEIPTLRANYLLVKNIEVSGLQVSDYRIRTPDLMRRCFKDIYAFYDAQRVMAPSYEILPLEKAGEALVAMRDRTARSRLILAPAGIAAAEA